MKRIGILLVLLTLSAFTVWAQSDDTAQRDAHKAAAQSDANAADQKKQDAKDASSSNSAERDKVIARLDDSSKVLNELFGAPTREFPRTYSRMPSAWP